MAFENLGFSNIIDFGLPYDWYLPSVFFLSEDSTNHTCIFQKVPENHIDKNGSHPN